MTQKPVLRAEVGMRVRCANKASAEWFRKERGIGQIHRKFCKKRGICGCCALRRTIKRKAHEQSKAPIVLPLSHKRLWRGRNSFLVRGLAVKRKAPPPPSKMQTKTCKRAACGLAVPPYHRAKPIHLPSNATKSWCCGCHIRYQMPLARIFVCLSVCLSVGRSHHSHIITLRACYDTKDEHSITQKDTQPSQTCSGGFTKTQLYAVCCCFFAIGECNLI